MKCRGLNYIGIQRVLTLLAILLSLLVISCYPPLSDEPELDFDLWGRVSDSTDKSPISGARLSFQERTTTSNSDGGYRFKDIDEGHSILSATHDGYQNFAAEIEAPTLNAYDIEMIPLSTH